MTASRSAPTTSPDADRLRRSFAAALDEAAPVADRAIVLVHVPKTAGTAMLRTARAAGWDVLERDAVAAGLGACPHCGPLRCSEAGRRGPSLSGGRAPGLLVSVGQQPVEVASDAAARLRSAGSEVRVVLGVRDPAARLASMYRFYWRDAFSGGLVGLARALGAVRRWSAATRAVAAGLARGQELLARTHASRIGRRRALDALHYTALRRGRLEIDAVRWLEAFGRYGPGAPFWLDEYAGDPARLRALRDAGHLELLDSAALDRFARIVFGVPSVRANVSTGVIPQEAEDALIAARDAVARLAERDAPFLPLIAEAAA